MSNMSYEDAVFFGSCALKSSNDPTLLGVSDPEYELGIPLEALPNDFSDDGGSAVHASDHNDDHSEFDESGSVSVTSLPWCSESAGQTSPDLYGPPDIIARDPGQARKRARPDDAVLPRGRKKSPAVPLFKQNIRRVRERKFAKGWHALLNPLCKVLGLPLLKPKDRGIGIKDICKRIHELYRCWDGIDPEHQRALSPSMKQAASDLRKALISEDYLDPSQLMPPTDPVPDPTRTCEYKYKQGDTEKAIECLEDFSHKDWSV